LHKAHPQSRATSAEPLPVGRKNSIARREGIDAAAGYRNGYGKSRRLSLSVGTITLRRPRVRALTEGFGCLDGRQHDLHPRAFDDAAESLRPLGVPVTEEDPVARQEAIDRVGEPPPPAP
jgi:hypothetical protein